MKNFNLFKRLGALLTAVAVLASMGTVAFATDADPIQITDFEIEGPVDEKYTITLTYTADENVMGDFGMTMLTYYGDVSLDDPATEDEDEFTTYGDGFTAVGINQWREVDLPDDDTSTAGKQIIFTAKMEAGQSGILMLGGHNIDAPAIQMFTAPWTATVAKYEGEALELDVEYPYGENEIKDAFVEAAATITEEDVIVAESNEAEALTSALSTLGAIEEANVTAINTTTNKATVTIPDGTTYVDDNVTVTATSFEVPFVVNELAWAANEATLADESTTMTFSIAEVEDAFANLEDPENPVLKDSADEAIEAYVTAEIKANGVKFTNDTLEPAAAETVSGDVLANIVVNTEDDYAEADFEAEESQDLIYTVTFADVAVDGVTVADVEMEITVTVTKYVASWDVENVAFKYNQDEVAVAVIYDMEAGTDKEDKAKVAIEGRKILLEGEPDYVKEIEIDNAMAQAATIVENVATVTVEAGAYGIAQLAEDTDVEINLAFSENDDEWEANGEATISKSGDDLNVTVREVTAANIIEELIGDGLTITLPVKRGIREESVELAVTEEMVTIEEPLPADGETYTATITVPADTVLEIGTLGEAMSVTVETGIVTVQTGLPGDVTGDGFVDIADASAIQLYAFFNTPLTRLDLGDVTGDGFVDIADASAVQLYAFFNTPFAN